MTYQAIILKLLRETPENWFYSHQLGKVNTKWGWIGSSGERRACELAEKGLIEVRHQGKYAEYRAKKPKILEYKVSDGRVIQQLELFAAVWNFQHGIAPGF